MYIAEARAILIRYLPPELQSEVLQAFEPEPQPGHPLQIQKAHAGYILRRWPHRSLIVSASDLLTIMDYALQNAVQLHIEQSEQESEGEERRRADGLT
jgi:hypothetical protein